jgi:anti-anti-sigma regulatory factor
LPADARSPVKPDADVQAAMRRVWAIYEAGIDELQETFRVRLANHPEFGPLVREAPQDEEGEARSRRLTQAALEHGDWEPYWENIRGQAAGYANAEISLASWIELIHLFRDDLFDRIVRRNESTMLADLKAADQWLDDTLSVFAQMFVDTAEQVIARQQAAIRQLSTPVLQLRPGLLLLPIVGGLDRERLANLRTGLLEGIRNRRAIAVVLDVTAVPEIDSVVAHELIGAVASAHMMGASVIVSGLSAEIANALVTAQIDLTRITSVVDLQSGIDLAESVIANRR